MIIHIYINSVNFYSSTGEKKFNRIKRNKHLTCEFLQHGNCLKNLYKRHFVMSFYFIRCIAMSINRKWYRLIQWNEIENDLCRRCRWWRWYVLWINERDAMQVKIFTYLFRLIIATPNDFNETQPTKPTNLNLVARNLEISRRCSSLTELEVESSSRTRVRNQKLNELVITKLLFFLLKMI